LRSALLRLVPQPGWLALALLTGVAAVVAFAWATWALRLGLHGGLGMGVALAVTVVVLRVCGADPRQRWVATLAAALLGSALAASGAQVHDLSFDGQQYHQQAAWLMAQGWNPLWDGAAPVADSNALWINGYAKTVWVYTAMLLDGGASIEAGKSFSLIVTLVAGLLAWVLARERLGFGVAFSGVLAGVAAFSPVFACQWTTLLNDHAVGSLLLAVLAAMALVTTAPEGPGARRDLVLLGLACALIASVKASGLVFAGMGWIFALPLVAWLGGRAAVSRVCLSAVGGLAAGVVVFGFNPYVTNTLRHGHPFYPLAGEGKVDIITHNTPPGVGDRSRWVKLFGSIAAPSSSDFGKDAQQTVLSPKLPGLISGSELTPFLSKSMVHIGGMGPWFSLAMVQAALVVAWAVMRRRRPLRNNAVVVLPGVLLLASALMFPEPWWARYVPQIWLTPLAAAAALMWLARGEQDRQMRWASWSVVVVAAVNTGLVGLLYAAGNLPRELDMRTQLGSLASLSGDRPLLVDLSASPATALRLDAAGVHWRAAPPAGCQAPAQWRLIEYTVAKVCLTPQQQARHVVSSPWVQQIKAKLSG
jgi:hypothetical protein